MTPGGALSRDGTVNRFIANTATAKARCAAAEALIPIGCDAWRSYHAVRKCPILADLYGLVMKLNGFPAAATRQGPLALSLVAGLASHHHMSP